MVIGLTPAVFELTSSESLDLPKQETDALLIQPSSLAVLETFMVI